MCCVQEDEYCGDVYVLSSRLLGRLRLDVAEAALFSGTEALFALL